MHGFISLVNIYARVLSSEACIMDSGTYFVIEFTAALVKRESK